MEVSRTGWRGIWGWRRAGRVVLLETAGAVRALPGAAGPQASTAGLLLEGFAARAAAGYTAAVPPLRRAIAMLGADDLSARERLRLPRLGCFAAADLWDDQAQHALATRWVRLARDYGALIALPLALNYQSIFAEVPAGRFDASTACFTERLEISAATGDPGVIGTAGVAEAYELAWRGRETDARRVAAAGAREATVAGRGSQAIFGQYCLGVLELGLGNYQAALQSALSVFQDDAPFLGTQVLPDLVEAAARCGQPESADAALSRLAERAAPASTPLALGLLARSRALLAADSDAEPLYAEAIEHLKACRSAPQLARAHLLYGEWLRRQRRRRDAREQLRIAHEMFTAMGAEAFAERARVELLATGERARQRTAGTQAELTPQEAQIARLVTQGDSNRDIAAQLFLSPSTVDYHLRKVFRKTGVTSRTQLAHAMAAGRP
jgi:DNA-binding CsgD family transcriptional regulator